MKKVISIFLTVLMLASSSGIGYAQHFCGKMKMDAEITFGEKNLTCAMDSAVDDCEAEDDATSQHNDCCKDQITKIQTDENFAKASFNLKHFKTFVATFVSVFVLQKVEFASPENSIYKEYKPPLIERDFNILYDTFLI